MTIGLINKEKALLHDLLEHGSSDIVVRLDENGFIVHASQSLKQLGINRDRCLFEPHAADLARGAYAGQLKRYVDAALASEDFLDWFEFPARGDDGEGQGEGLGEEPTTPCRWFALNVQPVRDDRGATRGGLGVLRSVERVRQLEDELFANAMTDPFTGLIKRQVFLRLLRETIEANTGGHLAVFAIDRMRALFMQYGQRTADEINWGFAKFLQSMALPASEIAQIDGDRFAVLLSATSHKAAQQWTQEVLETFAALTLPSSGKAPKMTASAGLVAVDTSVDRTMRQAELALIMAAAGGGNRSMWGGDPLMPASNRPANDAGLAHGRLGVLSPLG